MTFADRVKETTTVTGTGAATLLGAVAGYRAVAAAYGVGDRVPYCIEGQTPGEWEVGSGTLTDSTHLARTTVTASSNAGALVNFSAGTKNVFATVRAEDFNGGLVDQADVGFDIVLCLGQSNMVGQGTIDTAIDIADSRVFQFGSLTTDSATYQKITTGADPLHFPFEDGQLGPASWFSKTYAGMIPPNRKVLLVPVAKGGTGVVGSPADWAPGNPGGSLYETAIEQANLAVTAAQVLYPLSRVVGVIWMQGETDGGQTNQATYATALESVIAGIRARVTGATNSWFVIGGLSPEGIATWVGWDQIRDAHIQVAGETAKCAYVPGPSGCTKVDNIHYNATGARRMGCAMALAVPAAKEATGVDVAPTIVSAAVSNAAPSTLVVTMSESLDPAYVPAASTGAVSSGHATTGTVIVSGTTLSYPLATPFVYGESAKTFAYTQPVSNGARDLTGNLLASVSGITITNNVAAVDTTAPVFGSAQVANASPSVIQITMTEASGALAASTPPTSAFAVSGGKTVTGVSISGLVVSVTVNSAYAYGDVITVTYTAPGSNPRLQDAAGNLSVSFGPSSVTNNVAGTSFTKTRLNAVTLVGMTEGGTAPDYTYTGTNPGYSGTPIGGQANMTMAGDGIVRATINSLGGSKPMLGANTTSGLRSYSSVDCNLFADTTGFKSIGATSSSGGNTSIIPADTYIMQLRSVGAVLYGEVSTNGGSSFTVAATWVRPSGTLYFQLEIDGTGTMSTISGTGLA